MQGEAAVAAARGHAHVSSGPVPHGMQAPPISFHSANTDGVQPPRTTNLVTSTIEVQRRCFPASLRMPPTSTMVVLATSRMFGHCMGAAIVLDPLPTRRDRGRQAACTARRQTPAGLHYLPKPVRVVEGPRDRWRVCEVSPLLGERARRVQPRGLDGL